MNQGTVRGEVGFSLIEVILALAILILGLVGVIVLFPVGLRASRQASAPNGTAYTAVATAGLARAYCIR